MSPRPAVFFATSLVLALPGAAVAQDGPPDGPPHTVRGSAVLTRGPLQVDTIPILCRDAEDPTLGFVTDVADAEWSPDLELSLWPAAGDGESLSLRFDDGAATYDRTFPRGTPMTGSFMAGVNIVSWDPGPGVDLYFSADCSHRLARGGASRE